MNNQQLARTGKAEVYRLSDGTVLKQYFTENAVERVQQDIRSLGYIAEKFGTIEYEGWQYRINEILHIRSDQRAFYTEFIHGQVIPKIPKARIGAAEYHAGVWLALYHKRLFGDSPTGLLYTDLNPNNIIINFDEKTVTAIDPGMLWGREGNIHEDLVLHIHSVITSLVLKNKANLSVVLRFLQGYTRVSHSPFRFSDYYHGLRCALRDHIRHSVHHIGFGRPKFYLFWLATLLFLPVYLGLMPIYLLYNLRK